MKLRRSIQPARSRKNGAFRLADLPVGVALMLTIAFALVQAGAGTAKIAVAPANTSPPTISGTVQQGQTLTADKGVWSGTEPITYTYEWQRCDSGGGHCGTIKSATATTYLLQKQDVNHTLRIAVTAKNAEGTISATSVATAVAKSATTTTTTTTTTPAANGCATSGGTVAIAGITPPARLNIDQFQVGPATITYGTRSLTARFHISACGGSVQGALVYVTPVPYGMFAGANEQTTGADGWATIDLKALAGFPVSQKQQLLVMFVRARKSGENLLGGVSSRRLVSFKVTHG